jgi:hypothetical protein
MANEEKLVFEGRLTPDEIRENDYWIRHINDNLPELGLKFEKAGYIKIPVPIRIRKESSPLFDYIIGSRNWVLNSYFVRKDNDMGWEDVQLRLQLDSVKSYLWMNGILFYVVIIFGECYLGYIK